jgi:branched-chain amino acid transport system substrate-binding protein
MHIVRTNDNKNALTAKLFCIGRYDWRGPIVRPASSARAERRLFSGCELDIHASNDNRLSSWIVHVNVIGQHMRTEMRRLAFGLFTVAAITGAANQARAQDTVKVGVIMPYSGQLADLGVQIDNGIKLYMKQHGDVVAGKKIEVIRRDDGGMAPDVSKRLAQELVVRDRIDIITGIMFTPSALAISDVSISAKKFMVIMNASTPSIVQKSPYSARVSLTLGQNTEVLGAWAYKNGVRRLFTMVADYSAGQDAEDGFLQTYKAAGGTVVGSTRLPLVNPDFSSFVHRAKDANPDGIFMFVPGGAQPPALAKALSERGLDATKIKLMGQGEIGDEVTLRNMGDAAIGIVTSSHYDELHATPTNQEFRKAYFAEYKRNPTFFSVAGYDGMHLIYEALKKTAGKTDGESLIEAAKGMSWESPRGPMTIDPETRDVIQTIYIRKVEKIGGELQNVEIEKYEKVKDPVKARQMKRN